MSPPEPSVLGGLLLIYKRLFAEFNPGTTLHGMGRIAATIIIVLLAVSAVQGGETFRIDHPDGRVEFTDDGSKVGAKKLELPGLITFESQPQGNSASRNRSGYRSPRASSSRTTPYSALTFSRPKPGETLFFGDGGVSIGATLKPSLQKGHQLVFVVDGREVARGSSTQTTVQNLDRGSHSAAVKVVNARGTTVKSAQGITFYLRQHSVKR